MMRAWPDDQQDWQDDWPDEWPDHCPQQFDADRRVKSYDDDARLDSNETWLRKCGVVRGIIENA